MEKIICKKCHNEIETSDPDFYLFHEGDNELYLCDYCMEEDLVETMIARDII